MFKLLKFAFLSLFLICSTAFASTDKVRLVIWSSPGGGNHSYALRLQSVISRALNRDVIIEFKTGAEGIIAARYVNEFNDSKDLVLMFGSPSKWKNISNKEGLSYIDSFRLVTFLGNFPYFLVTHTSREYNSLNDILLKSNYTNISYGISLNAPPRELFKDLFRQLGNSSNVAEITYKGGNESVMSVASNVVDFGIGSPEYIMPLVDAGKIKIIGILDSKTSIYGKTLQQQGINVADEFKYYANIFMWANLGAPIEDINKVKNVIQQYLLSDESSEHREKTFMRFKEEDFIESDKKLKIILN
jgi:tripartite-type tricarboxylate transporter receptor subunit TctC